MSVIRFLFFVVVLWACWWCWATAMAWWQGLILVLVLLAGLKSWMQAEMDHRLEISERESDQLVD